MHSVVVQELFSRLSKVMLVILCCPLVPRGLMMVVVVVAAVVAEGEGKPGVLVMIFE